MLELISKNMSPLLGSTSCWWEASLEKSMSHSHPLHCFSSVPQVTVSWQTGLSAHLPHLWWNRTGLSVAESAIGFLIKKSLCSLRIWNSFLFQFGCFTGEPRAPTLVSSSSCARCSLEGVPVSAEPGLSELLPLLLLCSAPDFCLPDVFLPFVLHFIGMKLSLEADG